MKVVLDTNAFISGILFPKSRPSRILCLARKQVILNFASREILAEVRSVLKVKFAFEENMVDKVEIEMTSFSGVVDILKKVDAVKQDHDDNKIVECALSAGVETIVSEDKHLLQLREYENIKILSPNDFLNSLNQSY
jgi:putative PIN family toxin of toxin-antitoxin system